MTFDDFVAKLKKDNYYTEHIVGMLECFHERHPIQFERKGKDLAEVVTRHMQERLFPLVDKRLGLVFGVESSLHKGLRCELFRYHNAPRNPNNDWINPNECADRWVSEGMGWYISSMETHKIVAGQKYRPDRFDKDLFEVFRVDYTL